MNNDKKEAREITLKNIDNIVVKFDQLDIGILMLLSSVLSTKELMDVPTVKILLDLFTTDGLSILRADLSTNGVEATIDQIKERLGILMNQTFESGLMILVAESFVKGLNMNPPNSTKQGFEDLGIEDPFK